jgi:hypothetical protein
VSLPRSSTSAVTSVAGRTGAVTLAAADVSGLTAAASAAAPVQTVAGRTGAVVIASTDVSGLTAAASAAAPVQTVAGRTGAVTLAVADVTGAAPAAAPTFTTSVTLPSWATAGRPSPAVAGMVGWNTDLSRFDHCVAAGSPGTWKQFVRLDGDTLTGALLVASGVNIASLAGSATTAPVALSAASSSSDSNVGVAIVPKGTGALTAAVPDSSSTGGNARGANAVDLQTVRGSAAHVASGQSGTVGGGASNTASGVYSTVAGGLNNTADGSRSWVPGGNSGWVRGIYGKGCWASTVFTAAGDAQSSESVIRKQTTDGTISRLTADAGAASTTNSLNLPNFSVFAGRLFVVAKQTGAVNAAIWRIDLSAARGNGVGTVVLIDGSSSAVAPTASTGTVTGWSLTVAADTTNGGIAVSGTGAAATTINWVARFAAVETVTAS